MKTDKFHDLMSIYENRGSILVWSFVIALIIALVEYVRHGDFTANMLQLLIALITAIAGVNAVDRFSNYKYQQSVNQSQQYQDDSDWTPDYRKDQI